MSGDKCIKFERDRREHGKGCVFASKYQEEVISTDDSRL
jgi:hypothetical protein